MNKKIKAEQLERVLKDLLEEESERVQKSVDKVTRKTKNKAKKQVEMKSPRNIGGKTRGKEKHYADDWKTRTYKDRVQQHVVISNNQYRLTHLLENGHFIFNQHGGAYGRTRNFPHIRPTQDMVDEFYIDELEKELKKF